MIDLASEQVIPLTQAARLLPSRPSTATLWRWMQKGARGRKLETCIIGGRRYTSVEALQRFTEQTGDDQPHVTVRTPAQRERAIQKAEKELESAGW